MNIAYNRITGQRIENISNDDISRYILAYWLINPTEQQVTELLQKIELVEARKRLRAAGANYVDIVLSGFLVSITSNPTTVSYLDNLLGEVKVHCNQGEFISAKNALEAIPIDATFTDGLKQTFLSEIQSLIDTYYPDRVIT